LVGICYAQSLDGSLTDRPGRGLALSGPEAQHLTHRLRSLHQGILVGMGTILADDPQLTVRLVEGPNPQPVILDSRLRTPLTARLFHPERTAPRPWIATTEPVDAERKQALEAAGARILTIPAAARGGVQLAALLDCLGAMGLDSLMVEGGVRVISNFLAEDLANFAVITISPCFVGGINLLAPGALTQRSTRADFPRLRQTGGERLGEDWVIWGKLK
jgi:3,4-dihydroxy 2-butanone 4-phosphate synthase/GTP cyclohydrolase II